jgi:hypothetical protein
MTSMAVVLADRTVGHAVGGVVAAATSLVADQLLARATRRVRLDADRVLWLALATVLLLVLAVLLAFAFALRFFRFGLDRLRGGGVLVVVVSLVIVPVVAVVLVVLVARVLLLGLSRK